MARIGRKSPSNFERRKTNYSYVRSEYYYLSGTSVSASTEYGPAIHNFDIDDLTVKQDRPRVSPETIEFNDNRRPFFEDQYTWVKTNLEPSAFENVKYYGSGTLASDEVSGYFRGQGTPLMKPDPISVGGKVAQEIITWSDFSGWFNDIENSSYGIKEYTVTGNEGTHRIYVAEGIGGYINRWNFKPSGAVSNADSITLLHDGHGFGRQSYGDIQYNERFRAWMDPQLGVYPLLVAFGLSRPPGVPISQPTYSGVDFNPPLPHRYLNPIVDVGTTTYDSVQGIDAASLYYPEYYLQWASTPSLPYYTKVTQGDNNKLTLEAAGYSIDYSSDLKGGDALSGSTNRPVGSLPGKQFTDFWNSRSTSYTNPTSGFEETWVNQVESGFVPNTRTMPLAFMLYVKNEINYGGEGVHRQVIAQYMNHNFDYRNYLNFKAYRKDNGEEIDDTYRDMYISSLGALGESNPDNAVLGGFNINAQFTSFMDPRFNNMYLYSPETKKLISYNDTSATSATDVNTQVVSALSPGDYNFNALPEIPHPTDIQRNIMDYTLKGPVTPGGALPAGSNFITLSQTVGSGTPNDPIPASYVRIIKPTEDEFLNSNQVLSIFERGSDAPGDLAPQAVGIYIVLGDDKFQTVGKSDYLKADNVILTTHNGMTSAVNGFKNVSAAHASQFAQDKFEDIRGDRINLAPIEGTVWQAIYTGSPRVPKGWVARHILRINGTDKDDVINKLETYLASNTFPAAIDAKDELPEILLNYEHPLKGGKVH